MHGADAVARILQLEGVEYLFSYPNHPLIDAAAKLGIPASTLESKIRSLKINKYRFKEV